MKDPLTLVIDVPAAMWLTANARHHWAQKATRTRHLRQLGFTAARRQPALHRANFRAVIGYPTNRHADPGNAAPTVKGCLDGIVDAGVLDEDDHRHVPETTFSRGPNTNRAGMYRVTLTLEPLEPLP